MFEKRAQTPIESRNYSAYYIVFSGLLFLGTMWAVVDEVSTRRPWKDHQKEYYQLLANRVQQQIDQAAAEFDSSAYMELSARLRAAQDSMNGAPYQNMLRQYNAVLERLVEEKREFQFAKSRGDEAYYFYRKSISDGQEDLEEKELLRQSEAEMAEHQAVITRLEATRDNLLAGLNVHRQHLKAAQNSIADLRKNIEKWETKLKRVRGGSIEIRQVMMVDYDRNPFNDPKARIDRCQTCHLGWNEEVMEDAPHPFRKHPLPEMLALHKPDVYGCTPCHRGQGPALTSGFAHGNEDHYWENPLLKGVDVYASCNECHENQSSLQFAAPFTRAKRLMVESGCHGCHEIQGYTDITRIGPELNRIGDKTSAEWVYRWLKKPKEYNQHTRMPDFKLTDEQAGAVTAYLMDLSERNRLDYPHNVASGGSAERGKDLVEKVGCLGCHVVGEKTKVREARGTSYDIAPELTRVGSKVRADWLYDWIRNPRRYNPTTKMPDLRLTDAEARDITAYLLQLRDERKFETVALDLRSPTVIERGKRVIREFGCNGCHAIQGMEKEGRVSVSLSNFGRKKVEEMDFGFTDVPHTWHDWVLNKLKDARAYQTDRIEQKMPVFAFSDEEIFLLRMFLLSQTKDAPDKKYVQVFDRRQQNIEEGRRLAMSYNCQQCHELEKSGGYIGATIDEPAFLPPIITGEGRKVQEPWLHDFLQSPAAKGRRNSIRPWIPTRMPTFGFTDVEITGFTKYFLGLENLELELRDYAAYRPEPKLLAVGKAIFDDFQCLKCHPSGEIQATPGEGSTSDLAPNLSLARSRLKPEWIVDWLADPGKIQEGTRMPTFWPDGQSALPDVLGGDARKQMMSVRDYVISLGHSSISVVSSR